MPMSLAFASMPWRHSRKGMYVVNCSARPPSLFCLWWNTSSSAAMVFLLSSVCLGLVFVRHRLRRHCSAPRFTRLETAHRASVGWPLFMGTFASSKPILPRMNLLRSHLLLSTFLNLCHYL